MLNIKEIALRVAQAINLHYIVTGEMHTNDDWNIRFAEALIAELAKQNEPVVSQYKGSDGSWKSFESKEHESNTRNSGDWEVRDLFTYQPTAEQIANETAEAIAKYFEQSGIGGDCLAEGVRSGAWKEFKR